MIAFLHELRDKSLLAAQSVENEPSGIDLVVSINAVFVGHIPTLTITLQVLQK